MWIEDTSITLTYILLAAEQYDIGACWKHIRNRRGQHKSADENTELLQVPENYRILNVVAWEIKNEEKQAIRLDRLPYPNINKKNYLI